MSVSDLNERIRRLSPEKRALLEAQLLKNGTVAKQQPIPRRHDDGPCALSFSQQRLWFLEQLEPGLPLHNNCFAVELSGDLDVELLRRTMNAIVERHESLRTIFSTVDGEPVQIVTPRRDVEMPLVDISRDEESGKEETVRKLLFEEARRPFVLTRELMFRPTLVRLERRKHILVMVLHHIASDGWSMGVLSKEIGLIYRAFSEGKPDPLPELPVQYPDYALWQRNRLQGPLLEKQLAYWKEQLEGEVPVLELPADRQRPPVPTFRGGSIHLVLPMALLQQLKELAIREKATLFMVLLAAFDALLQRYSGQDDLIVGTPVAGRTRTELEGMIGFFVNTLPIRMRMGGDPTFRELLARVREASLGAFENQEVPFERLVEELHPERSRSHMPLCQTMFILQNMPLEYRSLPWLSFRPLDLHSGTAKFDLTLSMMERDGGLRADLEYNGDIFDEATATRMLGHLSTLLEGVVTDANRTLSQLPLMDAGEAHRVLVEWNATDEDVSAESTIQQLFETQTALTPDRVAVFDDHRQFTYDEVNRKANQLANHLRTLAVGPGSVVAVGMDRSPELLPCLLGVLKAGAAYLPLDPGYPLERLASMVEDASPNAIVGQSRLLEKLPASDAATIAAETIWETVEREDDGNLAHQGSPDDPLYVIYTSGSTGKPKGVVGLHGGTINRLNWMWRHYPFAPGEICCQKTRLSFVDSVWELFGPLLQGIPSYVLPDAIVKDPVRLVDTLALHRITRIVLVPALLRAVLDSGSDIGKRLPLLSLWVSSGEPLPKELVARFREQFQRATLLNLYGSTEVAADATFYDTRAMDMSSPSVPIGRPISNTRVYLLDRNSNPVPIGVRGEIHVGGRGLARGYLNRPDLTDERFVPNPFATVQGELLYRTGDLGRYLPDGNLEYCGRIDHQVKLRGYRVELGEVEAALESHPGVAQATVVPRPDGSDNLQLIAYLISRQSPAPQPRELRRFLEAILPDYMVPAAFVALDGLPLTPNGKVDRQALPAPTWTAFGATQQFVAPRTPIEETVAAVWAEVLGVDRVGVEDSFFDLGGHSIMAVQIISRIGNEFQVELPLASLFETPTVAGIALAISRSLVSESTDEELEQLLGELEAAG